jgi:hypothetical protein
MHSMLETAWMNTVQQVPAGRSILVTSDHGYIYFGPSRSSQAQASALTSSANGAAIESRRDGAIRAYPEVEPRANIASPSRGVKIGAGRRA